MVEELPAMQCRWSGPRLQCCERLSGAELRSEKSEMSHSRVVFALLQCGAGGAASAKSPRLRPLPKSPSSEPRAGMGMDVDVGGQVVRENGPRRSV